MLYTVRPKEQMRFLSFTFTCAPHFLSNGARNCARWISRHVLLTSWLCCGLIAECTGYYHVPAVPSDAGVDRSRYRNAPQRSICALFDMAQRAKSLWQVAAAFTAFEPFGCNVYDGGEIKYLLAYIRFVLTAAGPCA